MCRDELVRLDPAMAFNGIADCRSYRDHLSLLLGCYRDFPVDQEHGGGLVLVKQAKKKAKVNHLRSARREGLRDHILKRMYRQDALKKQGGKCLYCTRPLRSYEVTAEHNIPRSRGGMTEKENIDAACETCNKEKGSYTKAEFNRAIHEPNLKRDPWDLYLAAASIRLRKQTEKACRNLRKMVGQE